MTTASLVAATVFRAGRFRNALCVLTVVIAIAMLTVSIATVNHFRAVVGAFDNGRLITTSRTVGFILTLSAYDKMKHLSSLKPINYASVFDRRVKDHTISAWAVGPDLDGWAKDTKSTWWSTSPDAIDCFNKHRDGLLVNEHLVGRLAWTVGSVVTMPIPGKDDASFRVCGISTGMMPAVVVMHHEYLDEYQPMRGRISLVVSECATPDRRCTLEIAKDVDKTAAAWNFATQTWFEQQNVMFVIRSVSAIPNLIVKVCLVTVFICMLIAGGTLGVRLAERRGELATLRALGFSRARVFGLIVAESTLLSFLGGAIGAGIPYGLYFRSGFSLGSDFASNLTVDPSALGIGIGASVAIGVLVALWPAAQALRERVVDGLAQG